jgi:hypothetical protein
MMTPAFRVESASAESDRAIVMRRTTFLAVLCRITGFALVALGGLILCAQCAEWLSYGNWNTVSFRYVLGYFKIQLPVFLERGKPLDFSVSWALLVIGSLIAVLGRYFGSSRSGSSGSGASSKHIIS